MNTEFDKLTIDKQVQFINAELRKSQEMSVTKLCKKHQLNKNTIVSRFGNNGYTYSFEDRQYIKNQVIQNDNKSISNETKPILPKPIEPVEQQNKVIEVEQEQTQELKESLKDIKELLGMKEQLKELIQNYNKSKNIIDVHIHELKMDKSKFDGELEGRLIKVYNNVNTQWKEFCNRNNQFKMQDLYSMALLEFMEKYK